QSGADHPTYDAACAAAEPPTCCGDAEMLNDPLRGTFVSTAFDASFCLDNIHRLMYVDSALVQAAAAAYPDWDAILVIVNDQTYGGAGGAVPVISTNAASVSVARHEWGHSFTGLADEYSISYPGYPICSDVLATESPCEPNVTDQTSRDLLKWTSWVDPSTPVPTPDAPPYLSVVGLFEGARYQTNGMYRPKDGCLMRSLGSPFCEVCAQEYVLRLYRGGWGVPANGVDPIEPGGESPAPGNVNVCSGAASFSVTLLQPAGGPPLQVEWRKDGLVQAGLTSASATFDLPAPGTYAIEVDVHDPTPLVRAEMAGGALDSMRTWTVSSLAPAVGDVNGSCAVDVLDVFFLINRLFAAGPAPKGSADVDGNGVVDVRDVFYLINFLFAGGPPPVNA
ncbi:MAG TPA: M64 family metallopeptidase, partial [Thermoanaerobaculia bacterium]|nr:M64 family metallopeptidase [Thermoanaerobaculia bacterium]